MSRSAKNKKMKKQVTRTGRMLGAYVPNPIVNGIQKWVNKGDERDISTFIREAAREKLRNEGIPFNEREEVAA